MTAKIIDGKKAALELKLEIAKDVEEIKRKYKRLRNFR